MTNIWEVDNMNITWSPRPLNDLGDLIGYTIMIICEEGAYTGGLKNITEMDIDIEVGEGEVLSIGRKMLESELTELYIAEVLI